MTATTMDQSTVSQPCFGFAAAVPLPLGLGAAQTLRRCYQVVFDAPPNMLRCQQVGEDYLRRPIWPCC